MSQSACVPATVLNPPGFSRKGRSLSPPGRAAVSGHALSRSIRTRPDRAHVASMPDTAWPISGHPPGSSRDRWYAPVLMSTVFVTTRQQRFASARLPGPHLTPRPAPFPHRSPRRSSANAACGGLEPPPQGDSEGPTLISYAAPLPRALPTSRSLPRSWRKPAQTRRPSRLAAAHDATRPGRGHATRDLAWHKLPKPLIGLCQVCGLTDRV